VAARSLESWQCPEKNPARDFSPDAHGNAVMKVGSSDTPPPALRRARTAFGGDVRRELEAASMPNHSRDDGTCSEARNPPHVWTSSSRLRVLSTAPAAARIYFSPPTESPRAFVALSTRVRERARVILSTASSVRTRTRTDLCDAAPSKPSISPLSPERLADRTAALSKNRHHDGKKTHDGERTQKKRKTKSALSLDVFSRAKRSTYDKRVVLQKKRDLAAAKVNKYRKIEKRLGDSVK
jgi:hypothetical protein